MKKLVFIALLTIIASTVNAQFGSKHLRISFDAGLAGANPSAGGILAVEPGCEINSRFNVGLRLEGAAMNGLLSTSGLVTTDYYFSKQKIRPFAGIGAGGFHIGDGGGNPNNQGGLSRSTDGFILGAGPRAGVEYKFIRALVDYNIMSHTNGFSNDYLGVKLGLFIGGNSVLKK